MISFKDNITFIIVTFNSDQVINKCIESINSNNKIWFIMWIKIYLIIKWEVCKHIFKYYL